VGGVSKPLMGRCGISMTPPYLTFLRPYGATRSQLDRMEAV